MISTSQLSVSVNGKPLISDVSLEIPSGKLTAITGRNGAGKSTLLKAICGDMPSEGEVHFGRQRRETIAPAELAKKRAIVAQHSRLSFDFTAMEVVLMGRIPHTRGFESRRDHEIARTCMENVGVLPFADRSFPTLSGGEKQRVRIAAALAQLWEAVEGGQPCYLLLDEPTSSQDLSHQHQLLHLLKELSEQGVTVCTIIHDLNLAAQYADHVVMLKSGSLLAAGSPAQIFTPEQIREAFECPIHVMPHPKLGCPLIVGLGRGEERSRITEAVL